MVSTIFRGPTPSRPPIGFGFGQGISQGIQAGIQDDRQRGLLEFRNQLAEERQIAAEERAAELRNAELARRGEAAVGVARALQPAMFSAPQVPGPVDDTADDLGANLTEEEQIEVAKSEIAGDSPVASDLERALRANPAILGAVLGQLKGQISTQKLSDGTIAIIDLKNPDAAPRIIGVPKTDVVSPAREAQLERIAGAGARAREAAKKTGPTKPASKVGKLFSDLRSAQTAGRAEEEAAIKKSIKTAVDRDPAGFRDRVARSVTAIVENRLEDVDPDLRGLTPSFMRSMLVAPINQLFGNVVAEQAAAAERRQASGGREPEKTVSQMLQERGPAGGGGGAGSAVLQSLRANIQRGVTAEEINQARAAIRTRKDLTPTERATASAMLDRAEAALGR